MGRSVMEDTRNDGENYLDHDSLSPDINKSQKRLRGNMRIADSVYTLLPLVFENMITSRVLQNIEICTICKRNVESCSLGHCPHEKMEEDILMKVSCVTTCSNSNEYCDNVKSGVVNGKGNAKYPVSNSS
ncbi:hypothetical protein CTI12_AA298820 [Artemisia annua]|uniref:Uncharacterized protein n=1 Tax=Artemisia annua TaxID=35608 RepID=A0A2U1N777_ARTAN|nr:hypothetical protein CTI12_AA298820 [Artemisia annua]